MRKQSRKRPSGNARLVPLGGRRKPLRSRRRNRGGNLLSLLILLLLIMIFMARRIMVAANPHRAIGPRAATSESNSPTGEKISPGDRRALDNLIQHPPHP